MKIYPNRPGEEEGDGGRQKSQSEDRSHTLPPQLSGELEDSDPGESSLDPGDSLSAPAFTSSCGSKVDSNSAWDFVSDDNREIKLNECRIQQVSACR